MIAFGCASCPKLTCGREGCGTEFCYHCKQIWHPNQTCDAARQERAQSLRLRTIRSSSISYSQESGAAGIYDQDTGPVKYLSATFAQLTLKRKELNGSLVDTNSFAFQKHKICNFRIDVKFLMLIFQVLCDQST